MATADWSGEKWEAIESGETGCGPPRLARVAASKSLECLACGMDEPDRAALINEKLLVQGSRPDFVQSRCRPSFLAR